MDNAVRSRGCALVLYAEILEYALFLERVVAPLVAEDDVVEHFDAKHLTDFTEPVGNASIFRGGRRVARGMIVRKDQACGIGKYRRFVDFPRVHQSGVQNADADGVDADDDVFDIEQQDHEVLTVGVLEVVAQEQSHILGGADSREFVRGKSIASPQKDCVDWNVGSRRGKRREGGAFLHLVCVAAGEGGFLEIKGDLCRGGGNGRKA